ncbi:hypothetical protein [Microbacterium sp. LWH3-1.2]|uniref:hypothetical protein n=1 Tax=Microbacterium sp. LWH3-1.2 TaxID=3135256 RepID=UPI0034225C68
MGPADSILAAVTGSDWARIVGSTADWVTLGAFAITLVGLFSAFLTRGRLRSSVFCTPPARSFTWTLSNAGASPVQQIAYHRTWITRTGRPVAGDGTLPLVQALFPGETFRIEIFDAEQVSWSGDERHDELRMPSPSGADGAVVVLTWRSPLLPWKRRRQVIIAMFGLPPVKLRGRGARKVAREMKSIGPNSWPAAINSELTKMNGGVAPTEESIQDRYPRAGAEISPHELTKGPPPQRVQLYLGTELLADGQLEEYMLTGPTDVGPGRDRAAPDTTDRPRGFVKIEGQQFELNESHRLRVFTR